MPGKMTFTINGADQIVAALQDLGARPARKEGQHAILSAADVIADRARELCPVGPPSHEGAEKGEYPGSLRDAITVISAKGSETEVRAAIGFKKPVSRRAHLTEFGTSHSAAEPFMRPALDGAGEQAIDTAGKELWKGIEAAANEQNRTGHPSPKALVEDLGEAIGELAEIALG